jgi:microcystin-dependent protein
MVPAPYIGEIRIYAGTFQPAGWKFCDGQLLSIAEHEVLFNLIGTAYGGDGETTFRVPDLRGRLPIHQGNGFSLSQTGGADEITLTTPQVPVHRHPWLASLSAATAQSPGNLVPAAAQAATYFSAVDNATDLSPLAVSAAGGSQPHTNLQPFVCVNFIIAVAGDVPIQAP